MKRFIIGVLAAGAILSSGNIAGAWDDGAYGRHQPPGHYEPRTEYGSADRYSATDIEVRIDRQHMRIMEGLRRGEINGRERHLLKNELRRIGAAERHCMRDGWLNGWERERLHAMLDKNSNLIRWARSNGSFEGRFEWE